MADRRTKKTAKQIFGYARLNFHMGMRQGKNLAVSKAQQRAVNKYVKSNYDEVKLRMPKGKKDVIQAHAAQQGESVNAYINRAIDKAMSEDDSST